MMAGWRTAAVSAANRVLRPSRLRLARVAVLDACDGGAGRPPDHFSFGTHTYPYFVHHHNCGFPGPLATERTIELALADAWLERVPAGRVIEVGAVTPYYWPRRVARVVDPADPHPLVSDRMEMARVDLTGAYVLCLSTLEHFGHGDYGLAADATQFTAAVEQLARQPAAVLATLPVGYNPVADDWLFGGRYPAGWRVRFVRRDLPRLCWREVAPADARVPYPDRPAADAIAVVESGDLLGGQA